MVYTNHVEGTAALSQQKDSTLQARLGQVYVATHDFVRAVDFYETALHASPGDFDLSLDLAKLYCRLDKYGRLHLLALLFLRQPSNLYSAFQLQFRY